MGQGRGAGSMKPRLCVFLWPEGSSWEGLFYEWPATHPPAAGRRRAWTVGGEHVSTYKWWDGRHPLDSSSAVQSPGLQLWQHLAICSTFRLPDLTPDLLNQKPWSWASDLYINNLSRGLWYSCTSEVWAPLSWSTGVTLPGGQISENFKPRRAVYFWVTQGKY